MHSERPHLLSALLVAFGLAAAGWFMGHGFIEARKGDRYVSVKGLSEREVKADLALWPLRYVATGNSLSEVQDKISNDTAAVTAFLMQNGIKAEEIEMQNLQVTDQMAQQYRSGPVESRYILSQLVMVRTLSVDKVAQSSQKVGELVKSGVVLMTDGMPLNPVYLFTRINDLKPQMIAEATARARESAEQFAKDSGSAIGPIRTASQGIFQILPRDSAPNIQESDQINKILRVVSTIDYYLEK